MRGERDNRPSPPHALTPHIRRPAVGVACCFALGTLFGLRGNADPLALIALAGCALALSAFLIRRAAAPAFLFTAVFALGALNAGLVVHGPSRRNLPALLDRPAEYVEVIGVVADDPLVSSGRRPDDATWTFAARIEGVRRKGGWERARGEMRVRWDAHAGDRAVGYGERWRWVGLLELAGPDGSRREPLPSASMRVEAASAEFLSAGHGSALLAACLRARRASFEILGRGIEAYPESAGLLRALILGYRQELPYELYRAFATTGTLHIVAISGLHVAVMAMLLIAVVRGVGMRRPSWGLVLAPALVCYTIGTGMSASAVRACIMAVIFCSAPLFARRPDGPTALAAAAVLILAAAPAQLLDVGFLFSFAAVAGLMAIYPPWMRPVRAALAADPWQLEPAQWWQRWIRKGAVQTASLMVASLAAWFATTPMAAYYFNLVSPVALLGNLVVVPLSFLVLLTGVLSLVFGAVWGVAAEIFNHANHWFILGMLKWVGWMAALPGAYRFVRTPPAVWVALWYGLLALWLIGRGFTRKVVALATAAALLAGITAWARDRSIRMDVLDVGQGNAVFVDVPGGGDLLVDVGPRYSARRVALHLRRCGVDRLRALVLTHGDADHIGGAQEILRAVPVDELWCSPFLSRSSLTRPLLADAAARGVRIRRLTSGDGGTLGGGAVWEVLQPDGTGTCRRADEGSLVIRIARGPASAVLMGGADGVVEEGMLGRRINPRADVLIAGNHGAAGTCSEAWLDAVGARDVVISVGADNTDGQPDRRVLERLGKRSIRVWRTDEAGPLRVWLDERAGVFCRVEKDIQARATESASPK